MENILSELIPRLKAKRLDLVFAAESGSRAWGFASPDSDYDVRFIFAKDVKRYLSLRDPLQDIQFMEKDRLLDYSGWDLRKALLLAEKSNPSLTEWLGSPITYADPYGFKDELRALMEEHFSPKALAHHYINFMRNIRGKYLSDFTGEYTMKRYFYAIRPILCVMWMRDNPGKLPPVVMSEMLDLTSVPISVLNEIRNLMELKAHSREKENFTSKILDDFISGWFERGHEIAGSFKSRTMPVEVLDKLFLRTVVRIADAKEL